MTLQQAREHIGQRIHIQNESVSIDPIIKHAQDKISERVNAYNQTYEASLARLHKQYPNRSTVDIAPTESQLEFYRSRAGDGRYEVDVPESALKNRISEDKAKMMSESPDVPEPKAYGPHKQKGRIEIVGTETDNLPQKDLEYDVNGSRSPEDINRDIELTTLYRTARNTEKRAFLHVDGGLDVFKVPDYQSYYSQYMQMQDGKPLSENQKKVYTAAFLVGMYDGLNDQYEQDGAYDPYLYLAYEDFRHRLANGEIDGVDFDTIAFALGELENHKNGKKIAEDIAERSLVTKLLFGFGFKVGEAIESLGNLPTTISGKVTPISTFSTAYDTVGETLDGGAKTAYTVSGTLGYMTPYMLIGAAGGPVAGNMIMFAQGLSSSMNSALREGQSYTDSLGYGVASATIELVLNKLLGATSGALGESVLGKTTASLLQKGLSKIPGSPLVKKLLTFGGERLVAGLGECTEESLQVYTDALIRNFFFDEHNQLHTRGEEAAYNGWIGFIVGVLLGDGKSNATASTKLLDGTAAENLEIVKSLHDATQVLSLNSTQQHTANEMLSNAERLSDGNGGDVKLLQTQVQEVLGLWTETNVSTSPLSIDGFVNGTGAIGRVPNDVQTESNLTSVSIRFMSNRDAFYQNVEKVAPLEGYEDIVCHADPYSFVFQDPDTEIIIQETTAEMLAEYIRKSGKYNGGSIRLIACESGALENGIAQQLADELGVEVLAPTKMVFVDSEGNMVLADNDIEACMLLGNSNKQWDSSGWILFKPKGVG